MSEIKDYDKIKESVYLNRILESVINRFHLQKIKKCQNKEQWKRL